jgi:hypothetical protein
MRFDMAASNQTLGLIAGEGEFPAMVLRGAKRAGMRVVVVGLHSCCDRSLFADADAFYEAGVARLGRWIRIFRKSGRFKPSWPVGPQDANAGSLALAAVVGVSAGLD